VARWENEGGALERDETTDLDRRDFPIEFEPPFRLDFSVWALRRRAGNTVDRWDGTTYRRALALNDGPVEFSITQTGRGEARTLLVALSGRPPTSRRATDDIQASIQRMLGLQVDLSGFYRMAEADDLIASLARRFRGLKPPRFPTVFESLVNAVACQQLSLEAGLSLMNRLSAAHGGTVSRNAISLHAFPRPEDLAGLKLEALRKLGFSLRKAATLVDVSRAVATGGLDLEVLEDLPDDAVVARLTSLRGIGRWSAEYILLRGLGRLHVFPGDDVGAQNNLARWLRLEPPLDYGAVGQAVSRWQPYAGMVYFHLLLDRLDAVGDLDARAKS
jgi:DNA-3-methyladenine glycosylase II